MRNIAIRFLRGRILAGLPGGEVRVVDGHPSQHLLGVILGSSRRRDAFAVGFGERKICHPHVLRLSPVVLGLGRLRHVLAIPHVCLELLVVGRLSLELLVVGSALAEGVEHGVPEGRHRRHRGRRDAAPRSLEGPGSISRH